MRDITIHPPWEPSVLAGTLGPAPGSDTTCNSPDPLPQDIVRFGPCSHGFVLGDRRIGPKIRPVRRGLHSLYKHCFVLLSNRCGISQFRCPYRCHMGVEHFPHIMYIWKGIWRF
ncbi:hypothetical protein MLD38_035654 [Melastoma candidum]|uniref:Uncharacterized protein n=1 Tax=Melastoma candidum TaxID=119954 RepID=A0ACB9LHZ2_9MYRT|nr:hypothetical protein MLD38_035654 [Melastoma candidum]